MNSIFKGHVDRLPTLFSGLMESAPLPVKPLARWDGVRAIYVFFNGSVPEHVGRTRNLLTRVRGHLAKNHNSASFAFKKTRLSLGSEATYKPEGSRAALFREAEFRHAFDRHSEALRGMTMRFLEVSSPVDQYLLELYAALELKLPLDEFETH